MMELQRACDGGSMRDGAIGGTMQIAAGKKAMRTPMIERAGMMQDGSRAP
jgi:hypothetical protein